MCTAAMKQWSYLFHYHSIFMSVGLLSHDLIYVHVPLDSAKCDKQTALSVFIYRKQQKLTGRKLLWFSRIFDES